MVSASTDQTFKGRVANSADYEKLKPLMQAYCVKMQHKWEDYNNIAQKVLADNDIGIFFVAE